MEKYRWSEEIFDDLRSNIIAALDLSREQNDEEVCRFIEKEVEEYSRKNLLTLKEREQLEHLLFNSLRKYDAIQELLEDPEVTEIMINGASRIFYEKKGKLFRAQTHFSSEQKLGDVIQQMAGNSNRMVNEASPIVDTRLADGSRVNIVLSPISIDGAAVSIRKFPQTPILMEDLIRIESITEEAAAFLKVLVMAGYNIFISGGTGSGKTTFLNALSQYIPREERIITIEDSAELRLVDKPNLVRLETRNQMFEGVKPITIRDLIRTALRMRPEGIKIKKGKLKRKKKRIPIPHTFLQHILGNLIPLIRCEVVKIIEEADDLLSFFHSILHVESILPINGICTQHSFPE